MIILVIMIKQDWVGKVTHWEMSQKFKFDYTKKWYMHNSSAALENDTYELLYLDGSPNLSQKTRPDNKQQQKRELTNLSTSLSQLTTE